MSGITLTSHDLGNGGHKRGLPSAFVHVTLMHHQTGRRVAALGKENFCGLPQKIEPKLARMPKESTTLHGELALVEH